MSARTLTRPLGALLLLALASCADACDGPLAVIAGPVNAGFAVGTVRVESEPSGALVRFGKRPLGTTPVTLTVLTFDEKHTVTVELDGYETTDVVLDIEPTEQRIERAILAPRP